LWKTPNVVAGPQPLRSRLVGVAAAVLGVVALVPAAALGGSIGRQHPIRGTAVRVTVLNYSNTSDITGTIFGYGHLKYLGK
jgi:hypothetical protein